MTASVHLATGAASGLVLYRYLLNKRGEKLNLETAYFGAFAVGIFSHVVFDAPGHAEYSLHGRDLLTLLCLEGAVAMLLIPGWQGPIMAQLLTWGMIGGALPDALYFAAQYTGIKIFGWGHMLLHLTHGSLLPLYANHLVQLAIVVSAVIYIRIVTKTA